MFKFALPVLAALLALFALPALASNDDHASAARAASCEHADALPAQASLTEAREATLCLVNAARHKRGLAPLHDNPKLRRAAHRYSQAMVRRGFFDHVSPGGSTMVDRIMATGYARRQGAWKVAENIAYGGAGRATPRRIVVQWMLSPGHRANILGAAYREIGVGIARGTPAGSRHGATYTTDFGAR